MRATFLAGAPGHQQLIARAVRILASSGLMDMNGHISVRDAGDPEVIWINSRRASRSTLRYGDVVPLDLRSGKRIGNGDEPPSEFHIHRKIMQRRPEVGAVLHAHPDHIVALSIVGHTLQPVTGIGSFLPESVPMFDDANLINSEERGEHVASLLGENSVLVLRGHGVVLVGATVEEVIVQYACAEANARIQYKAAALGAPRVLRGDELASVRRESWTAAIIAKHWHYHEETARRNDAFADME